MKNLLALSMLAVLSACGTGRATPPQRNSPVPAGISGAITTGYVDQQRDGAPAWIDGDTGRLMWVKNDAPVVLHDEDLNQVMPFPSGVRVFDDGSFLLFSLSKVVAYPVSGAPVTLDLQSLDATADGLSADDFWTFAWPQSGGDLQLCHRVLGQAPGCTSVPNGAGFGNVALVLASDGGVYVNARDSSLFHFSNGSLTPVTGWEGVAVTRLRHGNGTVFALDGSGTLFSLSGDAATKLQTKVLDVAGAADDFIYMQADHEVVLQDSACVPSIFGFCPTKELWTQLTWFRVHGGQTTEIGHDDCIRDTGTTCSEPGANMSVMNGELLMIGSAVFVLGL